MTFSDLLKALPPDITLYIVTNGKHVQEKLINIVFSDNRIGLKYSIMISPDVLNDMSTEMLDLMLKDVLTEGFRKLHIDFKLDIDDPGKV